MTALVDDRALDPTPDKPASADRLIDAVLAISGELDLHSVLAQVVEAAADLTGARHATLGIAGPDGELGEFVTHGPSMQPHGHALLDVTVRVRGIVFAELFLDEKEDAEPFTEHDRRVVGTLARAAAIGIENARAYGVSERRRRVLESAASLSEALQPPIEVTTALLEVLDGARALCGATTGAVVQFPTGEHPVIAAVDDGAEEDLAPIVRRIVRELRIVEDREVAVDIDLGEGWALVVPLLAHLASPGALVLVTPARPTDDQRESVLGYVDQAGLALDRALALTERHEHALMTERARIGRDLHDVVIQRLFASGLKLQSLVVPTGHDDLRARIDAIVDDLDVTIHDIRTTIFDLQRDPPDPG